MSGPPKFISPESNPSLAELVDLAHGLERRAAASYAHLAEELRLHGNENAAETFDWLAEEEAGHIKAVETLAHEFQTDPREADIRASDEEAEAQTDADSGPYLLTPYEAFDRAVANERRAFSFFSRIAAHAEEDAVREFAERLAKEELGHLALCRLERRRAYRIQAEEKGSFEDEVTLSSVSELQAHRDETRIRLARLYRAAGHTAGRVGEYGTAKEMEALAREMGAREMGAREMGPQETSAGAPGSVNSTGRENAEVRSCFAVVRHALEETERAYTWYLAVADRADDEEILFAAQDVVADLIRPMRLIRLQLDQLSP